MDAYKKCLIKEHSQLVDKINELDEYIYSEKSDNDNKVEYANKCMQLNAMKLYAKALGCRLFNAGIVYDCGTYLEHVQLDTENNCVCTCDCDNVNE